MKNGVVRESCGAANLSKSRAGSYIKWSFEPDSIKKRHLH